MSLKRWTLDSCPCIMQYDDATMTFVKWEARCDEHKLLDGQPMFDGVLAHNQSFNNQFTLGPSPTREEFRTETFRVKKLKTDEAKRIQRNGPTEREVRT